MTEPTPLLAVDSVWKSFGSKAVLTSASLRVFPGRVTALLGRNGIGKSTLLSIAGGMLRSDLGAIRYDGRSLESAQLWRLAKDGLFFWPARATLSPAFTVEHQLTMIARLFGSSPETAIERLRLGEFLSRRIGEVSPGERRRAEAAAALTRHPRCVLADEPFRGLAPLDRDLIRDALREMARQGAAVVVSGHEVADVLAFADDITWCTSGTTIELGSPEQAANNDSFRRDYLG